MLDKENKMANELSKKEKYDLTVTAKISIEQCSENNLISFLEKEFNKDNKKTKDDHEGDTVEKNITEQIQKEINKDLKKLPGQFLGVEYNADTYKDSIKEDKEYGESVKKFLGKSN